MVLQIQAAYHRALRSAFWLQMFSILLCSLVLDFGHFFFRYLCVTGAFWMVAGFLALTYSHPPKLLRLLLGIAPQLIFWLMFFFPWWI